MTPHAPRMNILHILLNRLARGSFRFKDTAILKLGSGCHLKIGKLELGYPLKVEFFSQK